MTPQRTSREGLVLQWFRDEDRVVFLSDAQIEAMTGVNKEIHRPVRLRNWLDANGYEKGVTYFQRTDGWYSVMSPQARTAVVPARPQVRRRA